MKYFGTELSEKHKELGKIIRTKNTVDKAKELFLDIHAELHLSEVSGSGQNRVDELLSDLTPNEYGIMPTAKDETIAWVIWHIARIEDLTMNLLAGRTQEVFSPAWKERLNISITDTGNALSDDEIIRLSKEINTRELLAYRNAVGKQTRSIISGFTNADLLRKVSQQDLDKVKQQGGVTEQDESAWLLDFWAKKDVAGLLLMPPTRHVILHLNDCFKWKQHIRAKKKCFRTN